VGLLTNARGGIIGRVKKDAPVFASNSTAVGQTVATAGQKLHAIIGIAADRTRIGDAVVAAVKDHTIILASDRPLIVEAVFAATYQIDAMAIGSNNTGVADDIAKVRRKIDCIDTVAVCTDRAAVRDRRTGSEQSDTVVTRHDHTRVGDV